MADERENQQKPSDHKAQEQMRRAAALRENLRRRKAQARSRAAAGTADPVSETHDSAGFGDDKDKR